MMSGLKNWTAESVLHDIFVFAAAYCFLTGFIPFAPDDFYRIAASKPAVHRVILTVFTLSIAAWVLARWKLAPKAGLGETPLTAFLKRRPVPADIVVAVIFIFSASLWSYASLIRHKALQSGFDMAIFTQAVSNTSQGAWFYSSIKGGINLMGDHFSPLLALFALPYKIWPAPECLLILQAVLAASSVFPLYRIGKDQFGGNLWALLPVIALVCYLPLRNTVRFDFHPEVAAMPLLFWACWSWERSRTVLCSVFLLFALLSKEGAAIATFGFGIYALIRRRYGFGIFWTFFSTAYLWVVVNKIVPAFSGQPYFYLSGNFLAWKDGGIAEFVKHIASPATAAYLVKIFMPVGFLPFADLGILLAMPALAQNITSRNEATLSIFYQYTAFLTPFVFFALVRALKRFHPSRSWAAIYVLGCSLLMAGVSDYYVASRYEIQRNTHLREVPSLLERIPAGVSVRTQEFLAPHLTNRKELHIFENNHPREGGSAKALASEYVVLDRYFPTANDESIARLSTDYDRIFEKDGFLIFKRKST